MRRGKERAGSVFIPLEWFPASLSNLYILQNKKKKRGSGVTPRPRYKNNCAALM